ncbi:MAG: phosphatidylglycerophosphatase A [Planctomycetes bacterium]|nr:phosphatidylglycerophosphatase A [Planctomycetota bacterium]
MQKLSEDTSSEQAGLAGDSPDLSQITPRARFLLLVGSIGPLGHAPASGTVAVAVAGIPLCWLMRTYLTLPVYVAVTIVFSIASMALHHAGDRILGEADSRKLVWDELAGFFVAMAIVPLTWKSMVVGFFLERFIDIVKVPPANIIDNKMHNGVGVVLDDLVAGVYTAAILWLLGSWLV